MLLGGGFLVFLCICIMFWRQQLPNLRRAVGLRITLLHFVTAIGCFWTLTTLAVGSSPSLDAFVRANVTADRFSEHTSTADASLSSFLSHDASLRGSRNSGTFLPFRELSNSSSSTSIEPSLSRLFPIDDPHHVKWNSWLGVWYIFVSIFFVLFAGLASGLTLGLMSIDPVQLRVLEETGTAEQKRGYNGNAPSRVVFLNALCVMCLTELRWFLRSFTDTISFLSLCF